MLELVKICQEKEFLCIHDDIDDLIESALNSKLLSINSNSQHLDKKEQEVKNVVEQPAERGNRITPVLSTKEPEHLLSMGYDHFSITPETKSDKVTKSNAENLLPILSECEVTLEDKKECDLLISKNSPVCDNHSDIFSDSKIDDDILVYDDDFEDIEYIESLLPDLEIVSVEEENVVQQEGEEVNFEDISQIQDIVLQTRSGNTTHADNSLPEYDSFCLEIEPDLERLINLVKNNIPDDSSNDFLLEKVVLFLSNNSIPPGIENFADDPEGDIRFLEELLIDDFILSHESSDSNFEDNPSIPRPPPEPPDAETDVGEEIQVAMINKDKFDDDYQFLMFDKVFSLLSAESEDTIFDP
nr:hypothetical protein [Tanacetum cinerariifolium]